MELLVNTVIGLIKGVDDKWTQLLRDQVATMELMAKRIQELETRQMIPGPVGPPGPQGDLGPPGERGQDGQPGRDGIDGKDAEPIDVAIVAGRVAEMVPKSLSVPEIQAVVSDTVRMAVEAIPKPRDGRDGLPGLPGLSGPAGKDGKDGMDGLGFDDMVVDYDGVKTLTFTWTKGEKVVTRAFELPIPRYEKVWKQGKEYTRGAFVTYNKAIWHADETTSKEPEQSDDGWTLAIKSPRDGRDGVMKPDPGIPVVKLG